ncbi:hypothetical protein [Streptomyces sp. NPDC001089]
MTEATEPAVHTFGSTFQAYNATQCDETIRDGDVLLIKPEKAIGIAWTWPFALTPSIGELHVTTADPRTREGGIFAAGVKRAEQLALELGWRIVPTLTADRARALMDANPKCGDPLGFKVLTQRTETGRERVGWLLAGTTGFVELDGDGFYVHASEWAPFEDDNKEARA